ncbi:MAG: OmpA family protein [Paracoccaceae bacterium]
MIARLAFVFCVLASSALGLDLTLPRNATETASQNTDPDNYFVPLDVYRDGGLRGTTLEGQVRRSVFRIASPGVTPLQILAPLREQLELSGYDIVLDCADVECGGFDFRFAIETLPAPAMYVNLRGFHFITGIQGDVSMPENAVTLLVSTASSAAHLQVIQAGELGASPDQFTNETSTDVSVAVAPLEASNSRQAPSTNVQEALTTLGVAQLSGLQFQTGSSNLGDGPFEAIAALAELMTSDPDLRIAVVGHTDNVGSLATNTGLSRARAESVRKRLIDVFNIQPNRIEANGVGYLAPIANNATEEGRNRNRRVEVVLLSRGAN